MDQLGKYTILETIGKGGMGMVYRASDPLIGRDVAIKMIPESAMNVPGTRELFYREAKSAGRLSHENIMIIYDVGETEGKPYIVMEYLEGVDLRAFITENRFTSLQQKLEILIQICRGLEYAHQNDVIHRDIKPENIRIIKNNRVKIMDFGIARLDSETRTMTRGSIGTPRYMSPEQIKGVNVDHRTDIFSFGVVLYEVLTGTSPFLGEHVTTIIYKILNEEPEPIHIDNGELSNDLQRVVSKCLEKDADQRYPDFASVIQDLNEILVKHWGSSPKSGKEVSSNGLLVDQPSDSVSIEETILYTPLSKKESSDVEKEGSTIPFKRISIALVAALSVVLVAFGLVRVVDRSNDRSDTSEQVGTIQPVDPTPDQDSVIGEGATLAEGQDAVPESEEAVVEPEQALNENPGTPEQEEQPVAREPSAAEIENSRLATEADQARRSMLRQKNLAERAGAATNALSSYRQASQREQEGSTAVRRQDYRAAQRAFSDAEDLFRTATLRAEQRSDADEARQTMSRVRQQVSSQRGRTELASLFQQADARSTEATQQYNTEEFDEALRSFRDAITVYTQIQRRIEEAERQPVETTTPPSTGNQALANTARGTMLNSKEAVPSELRDHSSYLKAVNLESQGDSAFQARAFDDAARLFSQAEQLFKEVAALPTPEILAERSLASAVRQLKNYLEREDADGLHAFSNYFARENWSAFFGSVENVSTTIETRNLEVEGNTATAIVRVNLRFLNRTINQRQEQSFNYVWTLQRSDGGEWKLQRIADVR